MSGSFLNIAYMTEMQKVLFPIGTSSTPPQPCGDFRWFSFVCGVFFNDFFKELASGLCVGVLFELIVRSIKLVPDVEVKILVFLVLRMAPNCSPISSNRCRYSAASSMGTRALTLLTYLITIGTAPRSSSTFNIFVTCVLTSLSRQV